MVAVGSYSVALDQGEHRADIEHWHLGMMWLRDHGPMGGDQTVLPMGVFRVHGSSQCLGSAGYAGKVSAVGGIWHNKAWHYHFLTKDGAAHLADTHSSRGH